MAKNHLYIFLIGGRCEFCLQLKRHKKENIKLKTRSPRSILLHKKIRGDVVKLTGSKKNKKKHSLNQYYIF